MRSGREEKLRPGSHWTRPALRVCVSEWTLHDAVPTHQSRDATHDATTANQGHNNTQSTAGFQVAPLKEKNTHTGSEWKVAIVFTEGKVKVTASPRAGVTLLRRRIQCFQFPRVCVLVQSCARQANGYVAWQRRMPSEASLHISMK